MEKNGVFGIITVLIMEKRNLNNDKNYIKKYIKNDIYCKHI